MTHKPGHDNTCPVCEGNVLYIRHIAREGITQSEYELVTMLYRAQEYGELSELATEWGVR